MIRGDSGVAVDGRRRAGGKRLGEHNAHWNDAPHCEEQERSGGGSALVWNVHGDIVVAVYLSAAWRLSSRAARHPAGTNLLCSVWSPSYLRQLTASCSAVLRGQSSPSSEVFGTSSLRHFLGTYPLIRSRAAAMSASRVLPASRSITKSTGGRIASAVAKKASQFTAPAPTRTSLPHKPGR